MFCIRVSSVLLFLALSTELIDVHTATLHDEENKKTEIGKQWAANIGVTVSGKGSVGGESISMRVWRHIVI